MKLLFTVDRRAVSHCTSRFRNPHQTGYSLIEALVVLTIAGTLALAGMPSLRRLEAEQEVRTAANTLVAALYMARSEAIKRAGHAVLCPTANGSDCLDTDSDTAWERGYLLYVDDSADARRDQEETILRQFDPMRGVTIRSSRSRDHVTYRPNGLATGTNLSFTLCPLSKYATPRAVIVSNTGRARISTKLADGSQIKCPVSA